MSDDTRVFSAAVIAALREAGLEILTRHGGWGCIVIEMKQGAVNRIYMDSLAVYVRNGGEPKTPDC